MTYTITLPLWQFMAIVGGVLAVWEATKLGLSKPYRKKVVRDLGKKTHRRSYMYAIVGRFLLWPIPYKYRVQLIK